MKNSGPQRALDDLFLRLLLRGGASRRAASRTGTAVPQSRRIKRSVVKQLGISAILYSLFGLSALFFIGQPVFVIATGLHVFSFFAVGLIVAWSAGELLFNKGEADILLHRPVTPSMLLRAKALALVKYSLMISLSISLIGLVVGGMASRVPVLFVLSHLASCIEASLFNVCFVIVSYQLCLKLIGRDKLEGAMTTVQVIVVAGLSVGSQLLGRLFRYAGTLKISAATLGWLKFLPPAWFGALDDAVAGSHSAQAWQLAGFGLVVTLLLMWLAFNRLAAVYGKGVQTLNEGPTTKPGQLTQAKFLIWVSERAPVKWFLKDPVSRASFLLVSAYILRDRDLKLRLFPGIAQSAFYPFFFLFIGFAGGKPSSFRFDVFTIPFASSYLCMVPLIGLATLASSAHYRASSVFRIAPLQGPAALARGGRVAFVSLICVPLFVLFLLAVLIFRGPANFPLALVGLISFPVFVMLPTLARNPCPLSNPSTGSRASIGCFLMAISVVADMILGGLGGLAASVGHLGYFLLGEAATVALLVFVLQNHIATATWGPDEMS